MHGIIAMLYRIRNAKQHDEASRTLWFTDKYFDLIVWLDDTERIASFQLVYDKIANPRAVTWSEAGGYLHEIVDEGDVPHGHDMTPILLPDGDFDASAIADRFKRHAAEIDPSIADFVYRKLIDYTE